MRAMRVCVKNDAVWQTSVQRLLQQLEEAARSGTTPASNAKKGLRSTAAWILGLAQLVGGRALLALHFSSCEIVKPERPFSEEAFRAIFGPIRAP